ncbi:hypothetical protein JCGZ_08979 [Jatropha curcas]|uniref:Uncharacterized protein n=1 Tax=Jatropha curcas TaxID=180498 RepID=A0A067KH24_JATCU|nr:hypothetical protein JCGZ_08979 [Jatropha curcas]
MVAYQLLKLIPVAEVGMDRNQMRKEDAAVGSCVALQSNIRFGFQVFDRGDGMGCKSCIVGALWAKSVLPSVGL